MGCVTLRESTERPESVEVGANIVAGCKTYEITRKALEMLSRDNDWKNPFGDGHAAERIVSRIATIVKEEKVELRRSAL